jgi:uncharacterized protein YktA (UPF0223 family)
MENEFKIDYDMFNVSEVMKIMNFMHLIEQTKTKKIDKNVLIEKYKEYRSILNNKALEKQYDKMLYEKSRVSIYKVMKKLI